MDICMKKWILVDKNRGIFLGTYSPDDIGESWKDLIEVYDGKAANLKLFALFSKQNPYDFDYAITFPTKSACHIFALDMFSGVSGLSMRGEEVEVNESDKFISVIDLIKQGYVDEIGSMSEALFKSVEETIH